MLFITEGTRRLVIKETVNCEIRFICDDWLQSFSEKRETGGGGGANVLGVSINPPRHECFAAVALRRSECDYNKFLAKSRQSTPESVFDDNSRREIGGRGMAGFYTADVATLRR